MCKYGVLLLSGAAGRGSAMTCSEKFSFADAVAGGKFWMTIKVEHVDFRSVANVRVFPVSST